MNRISLLATLLACTVYGANAQTTVTQDSTGLPGDNFSLAGALDMFKQAGSTEEFEKLINNPGNNVNNLDLNEDGEVDYVKVIDRQENDAHAIVLQAQVSETESQDVAVIEVEKNGADNATLQIVGDEDIYGEQTILEPLERTAAPATVSPGASATRTRVVVNVWAWPAVRFMYAPAYTVWVSPWGWRAHPAWWRPWRPVRWHAFYAGYAPYRPHYTVVRVHRVQRAHRVYVPVRTTSVTVVNRNRATVTHYRTTRVSPGNGHRNTKATRTTTTVHRRNGSKTTRTTTRVRKRRD